MFQISWAIAICPVNEFMALDVFFFRLANTRPTVSWRAGALEGFGSQKPCSRLRMVVMLRNFQNGKEAGCIDEKHKTYMIQYVHLANNFALSQGIFNPI